MGLVEISRRLATRRLGSACEAVGFRAAGVGTMELDSVDLGECRKVKRAYGRTVVIRILFAALGVASLSAADCHGSPPSAAADAKIKGFVFTGPGSCWVR